MLCFHHMASVPCTRTCNPLMRGLSHPGKKKEKEAEDQSGHPSNKETGLKEKIRCRPVPRVVQAGTILQYDAHSILLVDDIT